MQFLKSGKGSAKSDEEVIAEYRKTNDPVFIEILFDRYSHLIFAVCMKYLKSEDESKDTVLRLFEKLPRDLVKFEIRHFSAWFHKVTKNECYQVLSKNKNYFLPTDNLADTSEEEVDDFVTVYLPHLQKAIDELNDDQKKCIELFYIQKMSYQEVCDETGYTMKQVKSYIQNGKRNLKIILSKKSNDKR